MRVRLTNDEVDLIYDALVDYHLCDECKIDKNGNVKRGTECPTELLIQKFQRIVSGKAWRQGLRGGHASVDKRVADLAKASREGFDRGVKALAEANIAETKRSHEDARN